MVSRPEIICVLYKRIQTTRLVQLIVALCPPMKDPKPQCGLLRSRLFLFPCDPLHLVRPLIADREARRKKNYRRTNETSTAKRRRDREEIPRIGLIRERDGRVGRRRGRASEEIREKFMPPWKSGDERRCRRRNDSRTNGDDARERTYGNAARESPHATARSSRRGTNDPRHPLFRGSICTAPSDLARKGRRADASHSSAVNPFPPCQILFKLFS